MKTQWKVSITIIALLIAVGGVVASIRVGQQGQITVQTGKVIRQDLISLTSASGEITPRTYTDLGANAQGRIIELTVKEGDRVRKGQVVARIESIQAKADVDAQQASVASTEADSAATEAGMKVQDDTIHTQEATIDSTKANLELSRLTFERYEKLYQQKLAAKQDYDQHKADYDSQKAGLRQAELRLEQLQSQRIQLLAQLTSAQRHIAQVQAGLTRVADILAKFDVVAPLDGVVTNLPVRIGETVVPGVQNSAASAVMTIADMSLITAEVKVDETDIVNLKLGQVADVTIDAIPDKTFTGHVIQIGNTAILRSSGQVASSSATSSTEAKDFKVTIALDSPPDQIRPGLSCNAKINTATRKEVLTIPIQALGGAAEGRSRGDRHENSTEGQWASSNRSGGRESQARRGAGSVRAERRQGRVPQSGDRDYGLDRYRGAEWAGARRPDRDRRLPGDPNHAQRSAGEGR